VVKLNKIYTRTGDGGTAGLVDGSRVSKASPRMIAIGDIDEANAAIGMAIADFSDAELGEQLRRVQNELFDLGADIATPGEVEGALRIVASQVERLEREIDAMNATSIRCKVSSFPAARKRSRPCTTPEPSSAAPSAARLLCRRPKR
jgi:cob(I)alamin adenosyltransferase